MALTEENDVAQTEENVVPQLDQYSVSMFDLRLSGREIAIIRAALESSYRPVHRPVEREQARDLIVTLDIQQGERVNNFGRGQR